MPDIWIEIGAVKSANPARRELRVRVASGRAHQFEGMTWARLKLRDQSTKRCRVSQIRMTPDGAILALAPGIPRDTVAGFKGASIVIAAEERRPSPDGMWAPDDLLDLNVVGQDRKHIGIVRAVTPTPAHRVIEIELVDGGTLLVPAIKQVILDVDLKNRTITIGDAAPYGIASGTRDD